MSKPGKNREFFQDVWDVVRMIPHGRITTYGDIAEYLGSRKSARMVGWAMNACPADVPAQRVVNRIGMLSGKHHFPPGPSMETLLNSEGIEVENDQVQNFDKHFWNPNIEMDRLL